MSKMQGPVDLDAVDKIHGIFIKGCRVFGNNMPEEELSHLEDTFGQLWNRARFGSGQAQAGPHYYHFNHLFEAFTVQALLGRYVVIGMRWGDARVVADFADRAGVREFIDRHDVKGKVTAQAFELHPWLKDPR